MKIIDQMIKLAAECVKNAYAPYSNFEVACCLQGNDDQLYTGVNVENIAYPLGHCAETSAIAQMVTNGCYQIKNVVILANQEKLCSPCGGCRQRLLEFSMQDTQVYLCDKKSVLKQFSAQALLPEAFQF